jgi:hypothetical protein
MDKTALGKTGLAGWREKVADMVADPISGRTPLDSEQVRALVGATFFVLSVYYVVSTTRDAIQELSS